MNHDELIRWIGNGLLDLSALLAVAFVVIYHVTARWWETEAGVHVQAFMFVIAAVLVLSVIRVHVAASADVLWFNVLRVVVLGLVPVVLGWRLWILIKAQILDRDGESAGRR